MIISLIGMSGCGKSYWSKKLEEKGFKRFCCDDLLENKLGEEFKSFGLHGLKDVAKWMGQPYEKKYKINSGKCLKAEEKAMDEILENISLQSQAKNMVVDTTGSVIYLKSSVLKRLSKLTKVVYLDAPDSAKKEMFKIFINDPKPVIWGDSFVQKSGESSLKALERCYPKLLEKRAKEYKKLADKQIDSFLLRSAGFNTNKFLKLVKND